MDESKVLKKILSVVAKQQTILKKLAQVSQEDPAMKSYLQTAWQTAGLNIGITEMSSPNVQFNPGKSITLDADDSTATSEDSWILSGAIPVKLREKFNQTFYTQLKSQKPELDGRVSVIYQDPPATNRVV